MRTLNTLLRPVRRPLIGAVAAIAVSATLAVPSASASDQMYFPAVDNVADVLVQLINAETVRVDVGVWYLSEGSISIAIAKRWAAGVPVRIIGDRGAVFEADPHTKTQFYWLASQGVPIRLRYNPNWYPEINHWKAAILVGQNKVLFGSGNFAPTELAPVSSTNYDDESEMVTDDPVLVGAFKTKFDVMWNDTAQEPSFCCSPPYLKNWDDACALESACSDYHTQYPNPVPMVINTARLEPDNPMPPDLVWGQGPMFNNRMIQEINKETTRVDMVEYRLTVPDVTQALLSKWQSGVPVRLIVDTFQYANTLWPEYWLTHAYVDQLYAAGIPIRQRVHDGVTHMKTLITSAYATNASSNYAAGWQRDHDYFIPAATKPAMYQAMKDRFQTMWIDNVGFTTFSPQPPFAADLASPASGSAATGTTPTLVWNRAPFATSYDVYLGTSQANMSVVGNVAAILSNSPPATYSWTPSSPLASGTTYVWKVVSRTFVTPVNPAMVSSSAIWSFSTGGSTPPPGAPASPSPANGATGVAAGASLMWSATGATSYDVSFGTTNPPPTVSSNQAAASYTPSGLATSTTYFWQIVARNAAGATTGPVWSFTTSATAPPPASEIVIYTSDIPASALHGSWSTAADATAAAGVKLVSSSSGQSNYSAPLASPTDYADVTFTANAGVPYTLWMRLEAFNNSKASDSVWVQFSDAQVNGASSYPLNSTSALCTKLATDSTGSSDLNWGWVDGCYWLTQSATVTFAGSGTHTARVQVRGAGVMFDQIVLSPTTYFNASASCPPSCGSAPGPVTNDHTIVRKPNTGTPPATPSSPSPAASATGVSTNPTLTWTASNATSYDVSFGTSNAPPTVSSNQASASYTPAALSNSTTYFWQIVARNSTGTTTGPVWSFTTAAAPPPPTNVVIYASDIPSTALHGSWTTAADPSSPNGVKLVTPDLGVANTSAPLAAPADYVDVTFNASAGTPYTLWLRIEALGNSKWNDSLWVQFSDALAGGSAVYPLDTTSGLNVNLATDGTGASDQGWGWVNGAYWLTQAATVTFATSGAHTLRIQVREDGVQFDQIVLSPTTYFNASASCPVNCTGAPGPVSADTTIVPKP